MINKINMDNKIIITPVMASGVGSFIDVNIDGMPYRTETIQGDLTEEVMKELINSLMPTIPAEHQEAVELKFYSLLDAIRNTSEEVVVEAPFEDNTDEII